MTVELHPSERACLWPLYQDFPALHGVVSAVIDGGMGVARVDDPAAPTVASLSLLFDLVAGDARSPAAPALMRRAAWVIAPGPGWKALLHHHHPHLQACPRIALQPPSWDRARLEELAATLPEPFHCEPLTLEHVPATAALEPTSLENFGGSPHALVEQGFGFVALLHGQVVAAAVTFAIGGGQVEIEIDTHPSARRRGIATALSATMILACLRRGLEPCWDAANPESAALAEKLGYRRTLEYTAWAFPDA